MHGCACTRVFAALHSFARRTRLRLGQVEVEALGKPAADGSQFRLALARSSPAPPGMCAFISVIVRDTLECVRAGVRGCACMRARVLMRVRMLPVLGHNTGKAAQPATPVPASTRPIYLSCFAVVNAY